MKISVETGYPYNNGISWNDLFRLMMGKIKVQVLVTIKKNRKICYEQAVEDIATGYLSDEFRVSHGFKKLNLVDKKLVLVDDEVYAFLGKYRTFDNNWTDAINCFLDDWLDGKV